MMEHPVILFDGTCRLCHGTVAFVLRHDRRGAFRFAALQSEAGRRLLAAHGLARAAPDSVVLLADDRAAVRSEAVLEIGRRLGGLWRLLALPGCLLPRRLADFLYDAVARRRYRWFGRADGCRLPDAAERGRFLDQSETGSR